MSLTLLEGPAGSGKSGDADDLLASGEADVMADLTALWAALRAMRRGVDGKYPVRGDDDPAIRSGLAAYIRAAVVRQALRDGLNVVVTSATPDMATRWQAVADEAGVTFDVRTIDPGRSEVERRLADPATGELSDECRKAIARWYG